MPVQPDGTSTTEAPVQPVTGRLLLADGRPVAGATVALAENRSTGNDLFGAFVAVFSLGFSCLAGFDPCRPSGATSTTTGADGGFRFDVADVTKARGRSNGVILSAAAPGVGGLSARLNPTVGGGLGDLHLWDPEVAAGRRGPLIRMEASAPAGADHRTVVHGTVDGVLAFRDTGTRFERSVDPRAIEDGAGALTLRAGFSRPRAGQSPRIDWFSAPVAVGPGAGPPPSRGKGCVQVGLDGAVLAGCPLTDGERSRQGPPLRSATVDMGSAVPVGPVAVTGSAEAVEVSADGQGWTRAAVAPSDGSWPVSLFDAGGAAVRYVRVLGSPRGATMAEVSVWPPGRPEQPPAGRASPLPLPSPRPLPGGGAYGGVGRRLLAAGAAALLAAVALAAGYLLGRRRRSGQPGPAGAPRPPA